jgi:hypothetical protein
MDCHPEERLTMSEVRALLGKRRNGRPINPTTLWRWYHCGVRGVTLRTRVEGGLRVTTRAWLEEFFDALRAKRDGERAAVQQPKARTAAQRQRASEAAGRRLKVKGL